ncbi:MAG: CAP domain-containing protein [Gammaproteobacteria bacterium]
MRTFSKALVISALAIGVTAFSTPLAARGNLVDNINAVRAEGCGGRRGITTPLRSSRKLDSVAQRISRGEQLKAALSDSGYRALRSSSMFMSGASSDAAIARMLAQRACGELRNDEVREIGIERRGNNVWVVLAAPFEADELKNVSEVDERILQLANEARSHARRCGNESFPAVQPLSPDKRLTEAAREQARDMAKHNRLDHTGSDGSTPATRVTRAGYSWRVVGENIASGPTSPEEVMQGWLASPGHCENLMSPRFNEMGVAYVVDPRSESGVYWSQVFGTRKQ